MSDSTDLLHGYLTLLYIFLGMFAVLLTIFLCKRCKSNNKSSFLRDLGREFGYRDNSFRDSSSSQTTLWRASSGWNSKSFKYVRHSTSGSTSCNSSGGGGSNIPSIIVTENKQWSMSPTGSNKLERPYPLNSKLQQTTIPTTNSWGENYRLNRGSSGFLQIPLDVIHEEEIVGNLGQEQHHQVSSHNNHNNHNITSSHSNSYQK